MAPHSSLLLGKPHGWRSLADCSPWGRQELDMTEWLHFPFSLSCIGEGNGNPLQCSCLENPRDGGAWWAAICGVAQSQTRLKRLSSSSSSSSSNVVTRWRNAHEYQWLVLFKSIFISYFKCLYIFIKTLVTSPKRLYFWLHLSHSDINVGL